MSRVPIRRRPHAVLLSWFSALWAWLAQRARYASTFLDARRIDPQIAAVLGPTSGTVVVLGGGDGHVLHYLGADHRLVVVEPDHGAHPAIARRAADHGLDVRVLDSVDALGELPDGCVDLVVALRALDRLGDVGAVLAIARRLLAPAGRLVALEPDPDHAEDIRDTLHRLSERPWALTAILTTAGLREPLPDLLARHGFFVTRTVAMLPRRAVLPAVPHLLVVALPDEVARRARAPREAAPPPTQPAHAALPEREVETMDFPAPRAAEVSGGWAPAPLAMPEPHAAAPPDPPPAPRAPPPPPSPGPLRGGTARIRLRDPREP